MSTRLQVLCVAMHQSDLSLVEKLNVRSDLIIANQADRNDIVEKEYPWGKVKMISTNTRGVGKNRNTAFLYADGEILLLSDDDMNYSDSYVSDIMSEFDRHPDADVVIFNIISKGSQRKQHQNIHTRKATAFSRMPYGAPRIAIRRSSWEKSNVWFTTLFGGGALYTNGEDSIFLHDLKKRGLCIYLSDKCIGTVDMGISSWYDGNGYRYFFNKGAYIAATHKYTRYLWRIYHIFRSKSDLPIANRKKCIREGEQDYLSRNSKGTNKSI